MNYYIGKCNAPCLGKVDEDEYMEMIKEIIQFLDGKNLSLMDSIEEKMIEASSKMEFEKASVYRDQLNSLKTLQEEQKIVTANEIDQDIIAMARGIEEVCVQVFFVRSGKIIGREHFIMEDNFREDRGEILSSFIKQFYIGSAYVPKEIIIENEIDDLAVVEKWLESKRGNKVTITVPKEGRRQNSLKWLRRMP